MTTLNISPKNPAVLALVAVGLMYVMARRKAAAAQPNQSSAGLNQANSRFYQSPSKAAQVQNNPIASAIPGLLTSVLDRVFNTTGNSSGPVVNNGTAGEAQAAAYYQANKADFQSPDPFATYEIDGVATNPAPGVLAPNLHYSETLGGIDSL